MVGRVIRILDTFDADHTVQTATEVGRRAGLPHATAHRIIHELVDEGVLERGEDHRVQLGMRLWELALRGSRALRLRQAALPIMEQVQAQLHSHTQLAVLDSGEALYLERISHPQAVSNVTKIAGRLPLHATSAGLVLLAFAPPALREQVLAAPLKQVSPETVVEAERLRILLQHIRRAGVAVAPGYIESVATGIAVPIRELGTVVAALSVVMHRTSEAAETANAQQILQAAGQAIEAELQRSAHHNIPSNLIE